MTEFKSHPDPSQWDDYVDYESTSWPKKDRRRYWIIPSICFNCESACGILAYVDQQTLEVRKIEGNPVHPGSRGRNCAKGVATPNQLDDPGAHPVSRCAGRRARRGAVAAGVVGRGARRHRGPIRTSRSSRTPDEVMYHVGRPGEDHYANACSSRGGRRAQQPHQRLLLVGAAGATPVGRRGSALARLRPRALHPAALGAPRDRPLLQPARAAHHRGQDGGRPSSRDGPAALQHRLDGELLAAAWPGSEAACCSRWRAHPHPGGAVRPRVRPPLGQLGGVPARRPHGPACPDLRAASSRR
jgi:hypothetical protein